jgi:hypothetical protein
MRIVRICWISMDMYGCLWIYSGLQRNISDLLYWIRYPSWISIHIHVYPLISTKDLQRYPHFISKNHIFAISMLLSIEVSIHIHIPLCISMCIQVRSPSIQYIHVLTTYISKYLSAVSRHIHQYPVSI